MLNVGITTVRKAIRWKRKAISPSLIMHLILPCLMSKHCGEVLHSIHILALFHAIKLDLSCLTKSIPVDFLQVNIGLRVLTRPVPDQLPTVYRTLGENFNERVLPSIVQETLKAVVAQYNASQLLTQREVRTKFLSPRILRREKNVSAIEEFDNLEMYFI